MRLLEGDTSLPFATLQLSHVYTFCLYITRHNFIQCLQVIKLMHGNANRTEQANHELYNHQTSIQVFLFFWKIHLIAS